MLVPPSLLLLGEPAMNLPVPGFALGVTVLICVGCGLLPALQSRGLDLQQQLKDGRTTGGRTAGLAMRRVLVAGQLSLAVVLLLGATLLIGTVRNIQSIDPGFRAENSLRVDFALPTRYVETMATYPNWPAVHQFVADLTAETKAVPGVEFAGVALFLAMLGVHGVLAYLVAQRGHEVGVRMALGATRRDVVRMVVKEGASMTVLGIVLGLVVAFGVSGLIQGLLYGVSATAPLAYIGVAIWLGVVALAATAVPAHRAGSINPVSSLRGD